MNVALIGLGNISVLYDYDRYSKTVLSHLKGIYKNSLNLKYIVDIDMLNVAKVKRFFPKVKYIRNFKELRQKKDIDILVIATPTFTHCKILKSFINNQNIQLFFVEKPLFEKKCNIRKKELTKIKINYIRNFDIEIIKTLKNIKEERIEKIIFKYSKGLFNNASHFFHLIFNISERIVFEDFFVLSKEKYETFDIFIKTKNFPIYLIGFNEDNFSIWEIEFFLKNKSIKIADFGREIEILEVVSDPEYPDYKILEKRDVNKTFLSNIMELAYKDIVKQKQNFDILHENKMMKFFERVKDEIGN